MPNFAFDKKEPDDRTCGHPNFIEVIPKSGNSKFGFCPDCVKHVEIEFDNHGDETRRWIHPIRRFD
jgi:hypothetical protein